MFVIICTVETRERRIGGVGQTSPTLPEFSPITFFVVALASPLVVFLDGPLICLWPLTVPVGLLSFASPIMRAKVMWKADWLSWIKLLFVVYATFLPASLGILFMIWR